MNPHYDVIIIGTGAGGGSLLNRIAPSGKRILVLERGPFLPREKDNWSYHGSFNYYSSETMYNKAGGEIHPGFCYHVGAIPGAMVPPILTFFAVNWDLGFAIPMLIGTLFGLANFILSVVFGPETKGTVMVAELSVA